MKHLFAKFILAVLVFLGLVWWGLQRQQQQIAQLPDEAAKLSQSGK